MWGISVKNKMRRYCEICGAELFTQRTAKCENCKKHEKIKRNNERLKSPYRKFTNNAALREYLIEIEKHNQLTGKHFTYGQYSTKK